MTELPCLEKPALPSALPFVKPKRTRGTGSLYKAQGSRLWHGKFVKDGKVIRLPLKTTGYREAERRLMKAMADYNTPYDPTTPRDEQPFQRILDSFLDWVKANKSSRATIRCYTGRLGIINRHIKPATLADLTPQKLERFLAGREIAPRTWNDFIIVVNQFFKWAFKRGYVRAEANPALYLEKKRLPEHPVKAHPAGDVEKFLAAVKEYQDGFNARDEAHSEPMQVWEMLTAAFYTGLRVGEIIHLHCEDVDEKKGIIRVVNRPDEGFTTKNYHLRAVPLMPKLAAVLKPILARRFDDGNARLFLNIHGRPWSDAPNLKTIQDETGQKVKWHELRHTFLTYLGRKVPKKLSLFQLMKIAGHKDIETTMRYVDRDLIDMPKKLGEIYG